MVMNMGQSYQNLMNNGGPARKFLNPNDMMNGGGMENHSLMGNFSSFVTNSLIGT